MLLSVRQSGLIWSDAKAVGFGISSSSPWDEEEEEEGIGRAHV